MTNGPLSPNRRGSLKSPSLQGLSLRVGSESVRLYLNGFSQSITKNQPQSKSDRSACAAASTFVDAVAGTVPATDVALIAVLPSIHALPALCGRTF